MEEGVVVVVMACSKDGYAYYTHAHVYSHSMIAVAPFALTRNNGPAIELPFSARTARPPQIAG